MKKICMFACSIAILVFLSGCLITTSSNNGNTGFSNPSLDEFFKVEVDSISVWYVDESSSYFYSVSEDELGAVQKWLYNIVESSTAIEKAPEDYKADISYSFTFESGDSSALVDYEINNDDETSFVSIFLTKSGEPFWFMVSPVSFPPATIPEGTINDKAAVENAKGWLVGEGIETKYINIIIRDANITSVFSGDDEYEYPGDETHDFALIPDNSYQLFFIDSDYTIHFAPLSNKTSVEVSYIDAGYYISVYKFEVNPEDSEDYVMLIQGFDNIGVFIKTEDGKTVKPTNIASELELADMNAD